MPNLLPKANSKNGRNGNNSNSNNSSNDLVVQKLQAALTVPLSRPAGPSTTSTGNGTRDANQAILSNEGI